MINMPEEGAEQTKEFTEKNIEDINPKEGLLLNLCDRKMNENRASAWLLVKAEEAGLDVKDMTGGGMKHEEMVEKITKRAEEALEELKRKRFEN